MRTYVDEIESVMGRDNPDGLEILTDYLGKDLSVLKQAIHAILDHHAAETTRKLTWNPNGGDAELIASLKDIIEAMALEKGD